MKINDVFLLEEAVDDMEEGKAFYNLRESGVGEYFWDSLISDIESLILCRNSIRRNSDRIKCLPSDSLMPFIMNLNTKLLMSSPYYPCAEIQHGLSSK